MRMSSVTFPSRLYSPIAYWRGGGLNTFCSYHLEFRANYCGVVNNPFMYSGGFSPTFFKSQQQQQQQQQENGVQSVESQLTLRRNISPPSTGSKNKPSKIPE
jgi:hypothetical protein